MKSFRTALAIAVCAAVLTGCAQRPMRAPMTQAEAEQARAVASKPVPPMTEAEARKHHVGVTRVSFMPGHGTQVSYLAPDGTGRLWYPGNAVVLANEWKFVKPKAPSPGFLPAPLPESMLKDTLICFKYPEGSVNRYAYQPAGRFNCVSASRLAAYDVDSAPGDAFGLMTRAEAPFVLSKDRTTVAALKEKIAGGGR